MSSFPNPPIFSLRSVSFPTAPVLVRGRHGQSPSSPVRAPLPASSDGGGQQPTRTPRVAARHAARANTDGSSAGQGQCGVAAGPGGGGNGAGQQAAAGGGVGRRPKDPAEAYMGSRTAGGAESHHGCLPIRRRPGGCETASGEGGDGGEGGGGRRWRFGAVAAADSGRLVFGRADGRGCEMK
nr:keratin, type I cytoskeletal 9-like [Aegilops tauschii subsp. strangulata]